MRNGPERDGLVEDQNRAKSQDKVNRHVENREQLGQGDEPGQVEEPELLEQLLQVSDDDAPAHALVDSEIIRDHDQDPWVFLVEYADFQWDFQWDDLDLGGENDIEEAPAVETAVEDTSRSDAADDTTMPNRHPREG
ncbi:hypothetical protein PPTG_11428 [Phytophthora nicotianae INRA-310]|uniref:Uncharacterized protein n=1 Tax=Phytophthora nicotianae (strain INRA-310) TaxID=761204 RepID=W2QC69_PHYN3|nr:hypothetical protein PPTG_11428 [Phytophthora nicotianae INRA-310]ETN09850.1 hypothetical protein PPTG_11428 [Phytophthora nicotianae INRA-310]